MLSRGGHSNLLHAASGCCEVEAQSGEEVGAGGCVFGWIAVSGGDERGRG